jgi:hypothetical protein
VFATMRRKRRSTQMKNEFQQSVDHLKRAAALAAQETGATVGPKFYAARDRVQPAVSQAKGAATSGWGHAKGTATSGWDSAIATITPLVAAATENARQTGKDSKKNAKANKKAAGKNAKKLEKQANKALSSKKSSGRGGRLWGLALAGAAVGAGAAFVLRRRRAAQWDEYDPSAPINTAPPSGGVDDAAFEPAEPTTYSSTGATATGSTTTPGTTTSGTTTSGTSDASSTTLATDTTDQTSSAQHSPNVARLASGQNKD